MLLGTMSSSARGSHADGCCCPACIGLECLEHPRFFAGQVLNETDLNAALSYLKAKNRLHNRYLHGWGTVCGLEVSCHECEGWVTVHPGYALDPCGNDLVVCNAVEFDVIKAIRDCVDSDRRSHRSDCRPYNLAASPQCKDVDEHWCVTITYEEREARPIQPLRPTKPSRCTCGKKNCSCGCSSPSSNGHGSSNGSACTSRPVPPTSKMNPACEPTRLLEGYRIGLVKGDECLRPKALRDVTSRDNATLLQTFQDIEEKWSDFLPGTLMNELLHCITDLLEFIQKRISDAEIGSLLLLALGGGVGTLNTNQKLHDACCRLRQLVRDLYLQNDYNVRCHALHTIDQVVCPDIPTNNENPPVVLVNALTPSYQNEVQVISAHLFTLIVQYLMDCFCRHLLPPCPPDPCDERVILACLTVRNGKIIDICNFSCRRFAGSFNSVAWWMSIYPILPMIHAAIQNMCCSTLIRANSPVVNNLLGILERFDPTGNLRKTVAEGDFALLKNLQERAGGLSSAFSLKNVDRAVPADGVNLAALSSEKPDNAITQLNAKSVGHEVREVSSVKDVPKAQLTDPLFARPGENVILYKMGDQIVGAARVEKRTFTRGESEAVARAEAAPPDRDAELRELREQLDALRAEVAALRANR